MSLQITLIIGISFYFITIFQLLKSKKIYLKYALVWVFLGFCFSFFVFFPKLLDKIMIFLGIANPLNGLYSLLILLILMLLMVITSIVSKHSNQIRTLVQHIAILQNRVEQLEKKE